MGSTFMLKVLQNAIANPSTVFPASRGLSRRERPLLAGKVQWNFDITKGQGTGKICLL